MELAHLRRVVTWAAIGALVGEVMQLPIAGVLAVAIVTALIPEITG